MSCIRSKLHPGAAMVDCESEYVRVIDVPDRQKTSQTLRPV